MKKVKMQVETEKRGFFGRKKKVVETKTVKVDNKTYKKMMKEKSNKPYSIEEMIFYDELFGD